MTWNGPRPSNNWPWNKKSSTAFQGELRHITSPETSSVAIFFAIRKLGEEQYGVMLADVMGHGVAAALYTMHLGALWQRHCSGLSDPAAFTQKLNAELARVTRGAESFATACCGLLDFGERTFRFAGAGCPPVLLMHPNGSYECVENPGLPLAIMDDASYEDTIVQAREGDGLLVFSDGALEVQNAAGETLGTERLVCLLAEQGYPRTTIQMDRLEEDLLKYSAAIRLEDDLTLVEARFS